MLASLQQSLPEQWRGTFEFLVSGFTWILDWQTVLRDFFLASPTVSVALAKWLFLALPAALLVAAAWCTMASLYTLPFRSGRGGFLTSLLMSWWDAGRVIWFYWAGLIRFVVVFLGWVWGLLKLAGSLLLRLIKFEGNGELPEPEYALLDGSSVYYSVARDP